MRSSPRGRGWAKGEANRGRNGRCTPVMWRVTREWAGMRVWPATRATPLTEVHSRRISRTAGCKTRGTTSKLFNKLLNLPNPFIPTSAGTSLFFLVEGSLESLTTNTGTPSHFCPKSSKSTITVPLYGISSPFAAFKVTWAMGRRSEFCRFSATHLSVTVVTSLPVSTSPLTFLPFITVSTVGHRSILPTGFMSSIVWLLTTGTSSFPGGMENVVQRCAAERRTVAEEGWGWRKLEGPAAVGRTGVSQRSPAGSGQAARTSSIFYAVVPGLTGVAAQPAALLSSQSGPLLGPAAPPLPCSARTSTSASSRIQLWASARAWWKVTSVMV